MLKTAADASLPLTPAEYLEFGNPAAGPAEFAQTMHSSPIHRLDPEGAPGLRVVCRTGVFDVNVYPYESLKWILTLRSGRSVPDEKYLAVGGEGHSLRGLSRQHHLAEDFLVLNKDGDA
jgi:oligopeptidase B